VDEGRVIDASDPARPRPFAWEPMPMVLPVSSRLKDRVGAEEYEARVAAAAERCRFGLAGR
jgi:hypothetical protein